MPILKYECSGCGKEFAKIFFEPEGAPQACPVCGGTDLQEVGQAFDYENKSLERLACVSCDCDTCGEQESPCALPVSS